MRDCIALADDDDTGIIFVAFAFCLSMISRMTRLRGTPDLHFILFIMVKLARFDASGFHSVFYGSE